MLFTWRLHARTRVKSLSTAILLISSKGVSLSSTSTWHSSTRRVKCLDSSCTVKKEIPT